ncbi:MAG: signal peptidase II [Deltaproteobacteria bacterium]|nr:signal peptidase II [Deltaproteobacteria bacterium]
MEDNAETTTEKSSGGVIKYALLLGVLVAGCNSDLATKRMVSAELDRGETVELVSGYLELKHTHNDAAAFSLLQQIDPDVRRPLLIAAQSTASLVLCILIVLWRRKSIGELLPYLLVLSGALGNVIDRIRYGHVVDFIHFHVGDRFSWPIFNVADILIAVGVGLILLRLLRQRSAEPI